MFLIDTNIFIYAAGKEHPLKRSCATIYHRILAEPEQYVIDTEVLQEILHVFSARRESARGIEMVRNLLILFPNPIPISRNELEKATAFLEQYAGLSARDALHAAVVSVHDLDGIISMDRDFDAVTGIRRIPPERLMDTGP
ncbi:MAG: type II toxin-antitoxin system VapC family toxin [Thermoanaerobacteraceae bacterium]|nr:type II toxin-antitoxin system VapC family toxin [Thermoanaerobacteraceae bacterium]